MPIRVTSSSSRTGTTFAALGVTMRLSATVDGHEVALPSSGTVTIAATGQLSVAVVGFRPGTVAQVWSPTTSALHQRLSIDASSRADGRFTLPSSMGPGPHTVALTGTAGNGDAVTMRVRILVVAAAALPVRPAGRPTAMPAGTALGAKAHSTRAAASESTPDLSPSALAPSPGPAAVVAAAAGSYGHEHRNLAQWWYALGAAAAGVAGWFFAAAWRRRKHDDQDVQPS